MTSPFSNPAGRAPAQSDAYVRSILELLGDRDPVAVMTELPGALGSALEGLGGDDLVRPEGPGKWSVLQTVAHLADTEVVLGWRLRLVLAQDKPTITGFDQDAWSARLSGAYPDVGSAIQQIAILRSTNLALLRSLAPADWDRVGMHVERGAESVRLMARLYAGHDLVHRRQIARIRATLKV